MDGRVDRCRQLLAHRVSFDPTSTEGLYNQGRFLKINQDSRLGLYLKLLESFVELDIAQRCPSPRERAHRYEI